jgi:hypothetical protein
LLAALTLVTLAAWLAANRRKSGFLMLPILFMIVTTFFALIFLAKRYITAHNYILLSADLVMVLLAAGLIAVAVGMWRGKRKPV